MKKYKAFGAITCAIVLSGCGGGGIGMPGSPAWKQTAPVSLQRDYY